MDRFKEEERLKALEKNSPVDNPAGRLHRINQFLAANRPHDLASIPELSARTQARISVNIWNSSVIAKAANPDRAAAVTELKNYFSNACVLGFILLNCALALLFNMDESQILLGTNQFAKLPAAIDKGTSVHMGKAGIQPSVATPRLNMADRSIPIQVVAQGTGERRLVFVGFRDMQFQALRTYEVLTVDKR